MLFCPNKEPALTPRSLTATGSLTTTPAAFALSGNVHGQVYTLHLNLTNITGTPTTVNAIVTGDDEDDDWLCGPQSLTVQSTTTAAIAIVNFQNFVPKAGASKLLLALDAGTANFTAVLRCS
jgi:hypothetical protein